MQRVMCACAWEHSQNSDKVITQGPVMPPALQADIQVCSLLQTSLHSMQAPSTEYQTSRRLAGLLDGHWASCAEHTIGDSAQATCPHQQGREHSAGRMLTAGPHAPCSLPKGPLSSPPSTTTWGPYIHPKGHNRGARCWHHASGAAFCLEYSPLALYRLINHARSIEYVSTTAAVSEAQAY